ncbi:MAG: histone deacetylase family protein [Pseudomonadota bacterium]
MVFRVYSHPDCAEHRTPAGHPESPDRLHAALRGVEKLGADVEEAPLADWTSVRRAHGAALVSAIRAAAPSEGLAAIDPDTTLSPGSLDAARRAVGAAVAAVDAVATGEARSAFCAVRPPGHHAEPDRAMGFCVFNAAVAAAYHAREVHGLTRVAVVDFDVHHGNGTQAAFWEDPDAFYGSIHQWPFYPGTGGAGETGAEGGGTIVNAPLSHGDGGPEARAAIRRDIAPALDAFEPDIVILSAGFDAHEADPLGGLRLDASDFAAITDALCDVAATRAAGRVVSLLEGGYDLAALSACVHAHGAALQGGAGA